MRLMYFFVRMIKLFSSKKKTTCHLIKFLEFVVTHFAFSFSLTYNIDIKLSLGPHPESNQTPSSPTHRSNEYIEEKTHDVDGRLAYNLIFYLTEYFFTNRMTFVVTYLNILFNEFLRVTILFSPYDVGYIIWYVIWKFPTVISSTI